MKILILASWYPNDDDGTGGIFVKEQVKALSDKGVEVRVFYPFDKSLNSHDLKVTSEDGIITYRCNTDYMKSSKLSRINSAIQSIKKLNVIRKEYDFDIIHCHVCYFAGIVGYLYSKFFKTRYLITEHMSYVDSYAKKGYNYFLLKKAYSKAEVVICVSQYLADNLLGLGFEFKKQIIGNVVDTDTFNISNEENVPSDKIDILFIGSMMEDEVKGIEYLLKSFAELITTNSCRLHLIGDGVKRQEYEHQAKILGIEDLCKFNGKMDKSMIAKVMQSCSYFVLPSKHETFGTVIIEALACGKPVVTTDKGGQREIICDNSLGVIVKSQDVESLFNGLKYMCDNYINYDPVHLREHAMKYNYMSIADKIHCIYLKILGNDGETS